MEKVEKKQQGRRRFFQRLGITLGVCAGIYTDARYVEPGWIEITRHMVHLPELPLALDGLVVAHLSDIHLGPITPLATIQEAISLTLQEKPDLIALTGDFINNKEEEAESLFPLLHPLARTPLGLVGCLGNHDYRNGSGDAVANTLQNKAGVVFLRNGSLPIAPGLYVAGIEDTSRGKPDTPRAFAKVPDSAACIYLTHNPVGVWGASKRSCLTLAGHTHGGQIRIPGYAPRRPVGMEGFPLMEGWGTFDRAHLYITRGIGMMHEPFRFRCRPELAIFTLKRGIGIPQSKENITQRAKGKLEQLAISIAHRLT